VRRGGAQRGVERDIVVPVANGARLDIAAVFAFRARAAATARNTPGQPVERRVQAARRELLAGIDALSPFPPAGVLGVVEDILRRRRRFGGCSFVIRLTG